MQYTSGNIFDADVDALINPVNTKGVMGAGLAKQFARRFPCILEPYKKVCAEGRLKPGGAHVLRINRATRERDPNGDLWIINLATKDHWRNPSRIEWVEHAMSKLGPALENYGIRSIAIPKIGSGLGGLDWEVVRSVMERHLEPYAKRGLSILVYGEAPRQVNAVNAADGDQELPFADAESGSTSCRGNTSARAPA